MDTTYYTFQTRKIKASGGAELVTFVPAVQPTPAAPKAAPSAGEVLDFDLCRRRLETRTAWKALTAAAQTDREQAPSQAGTGAQPHRSQPIQQSRPACRTRAPWAEICASALALSLVCLVGAVALLSLV